MSQQGPISLNNMIIKPRINNLTDNKNGKTVKLGDNHRIITTVKTPKSFLGAKIIQDGKLVYLPYKELDKNTNTYKSISGELKETINWKSKELGVSFEQVDELGKRMVYTVSNDKEEIVSTEEDIPESKVLQLKKEYAEYIDKKLSALNTVSGGAYSEHADNILNGKLDRFQYVVDLGAAKSIQSTDTSSIESNDRDTNSIASDANDTVGSLIVPTENNEMLTNNTNLFSKIVDFTSEMKQKIFNFSYKKISPETMETNILDKIRKHVNDLKDNNMELSDDDFMKFLENKGIIKEYIDYKAKSEEYKDLMNLSVNAVKSNYKNLFGVIKAVLFNKGDQNLNINIERVPLKTKEQLKEYFTLRKEGRAIMDKLQSCFDEHKKLVQDKLDLLSRKTAEDLIYRLTKELNTTNQNS